MRREATLISRVDWKPLFWRPTFIITLGGFLAFLSKQVLPEFMIAGQIAGYLVASLFALLIRSRKPGRLEVASTLALGCFFGLFFTFSSDLSGAFPSPIILYVFAAFAVLTAMSLYALTLIRE